MVYCLLLFNIGKSVANTIHAVTQTYMASFLLRPTAIPLTLEPIRALNARGETAYPKP